MARLTRLVVVAVVLTLGAEPALAQDQAGVLGFDLHENYPNPFDTSTTIPFTLDEALFAEASRVVVTMRVFNLLSQPVAHPVAVAHPEGAVAVRSLSYTRPGRYEALWDGTDDNGERVAPETYIVELAVSGRQLQRRILRIDSG